MTQAISIKIMSLWDCSLHEYSVLTDRVDPKEILDQVFLHQQDDDKMVPNLPSLSAGDVVIMDQVAFLCAGSGWAKLELVTFLKWLNSTPTHRMLDAGRLRVPRDSYPTV